MHFTSFQVLIKLCKQKKAAAETTGKKDCAACVRDVAVFIRSCVSCELCERANDQGAHFDNCT